MEQNKILDFIKQPLIVFLLKAFLIWFGWMLIYGIIFKENQINDPMTKIEAKMTAFVLRQMGYDAKLDEGFTKTLVREEGKQKITALRKHHFPLFQLIFLLFLCFHLYWGKSENE